MNNKSQKKFFLHENRKSLYAGYARIEIVQLE